jgi:hypothetical protein
MSALIGATGERKPVTEQEGKGRHLRRESGAKLHKQSDSDSVEASRLGRLARPAKDSHRRAQGGRMQEKKLTLILELTLIFSRNLV